jgi:hypothetical protein
VLIEDVKAYDNGKDGISVMGANLDGVTINKANVYNNGATGVLIRGAASIADVTVAEADIHDQTAQLSYALQVRTDNGNLTDISVLVSTAARNERGVNWRFLAGAGKSSAQWSPETN